MPQSKEVHKEYMRSYRDKRRKGIITIEEIKAPRKSGERTIPDVIDDGSPPEGSQYPAIIHALADPDKRVRLEKIHQSLKEFNQLKNVFYGYPGLGGIPFDAVGDYLEATK